MSAPITSVVIPTYHREDLLVGAVRSALAQDGVSVEVLVIDDSPECSARGAVSAIGDDRVRYLPAERPSGGFPARLRNQGLAEARGRYVTFLDDDDELEPGALETLASALDRTGAGFAVGFVTPVATDEEILRHEEAYFAAAERVLLAARRRPSMLATLLYGPAPLVNSACMVRRSAALGVGGHAEDVPRCEDAGFASRVVRNHGFVVVPRHVVQYRVSRDSLIHSASLELVGQSYRRIRRHYREQHGLLELLALRIVAAVHGIRRTLRVAGGTA